MYGQGLASFRKQLMKTIYHLRGAGSSRYGKNPVFIFNFFGDRTPSRLDKEY